MNVGDAVNTGDAIAGDGGGLPRDAGPGDVSGPARGSLAELAASCPGTLAVCVPGLLGVNEDAVLPLASTGKVLLLAALARDVAAGAVDPAEPVGLLDEDYAGVLACSPSCRPAAGASATSPC